MKPITFVVDRTLGIVALAFLGAFSLLALPLNWLEARERNKENQR